MSKKAWIIGGVAVVVVIGATIIGRSLAGAPAKEGETASSGEVITLKVEIGRASCRERVCQYV